MVNHILLAEKVKAEEEYKRQKYLNEQMKNKIKKSNVDPLKTFGEVILDGTPDTVSGIDSTYQKLKNKIVYKTGGDKYLTRGKELITKIGDMNE